MLIIFLGRHDGSFFVCLWTHEENKDHSTTTEDETGKRCQFESLKDNPFDNQMAHAFTRDNELTGCYSARSEGRWQSCAYMNEIHLTQHGDSKSGPNIACHPKSASSQS